jgi:hypothetical protein
LVRTWTEDHESHLWQVPNPEYLQSVQGVGVIGRTLREEGRFREAVLLSVEKGMCSVQERYPKTAEDGSLEIAANMIRLEPAREPTESVFDDVKSLLQQAIYWCIANDEFLVVEKGGFDAPQTPYCLFIVVAEDGGVVTVIETAPEPHGSELWKPHIVSGSGGATLTAPTSEETVDAAPIVMMDAISTWRLEPWDLALTFGRRGSP